MKATFLGHSTTLIEIDGVRVITDPLFTSRFFHVKRRAPVIIPENIDLTLLSHAHIDHTHRKSLQEVKDSPIIASLGASRKIKEAATVLQPGEKTTALGLEVEATYADHQTDKGNPVGFIITGSKRIYFAGDTDLFDDMDQIEDIDLAFLPIWGWGTKIGKGHLNPERAARALEIIKPKVAIPIHWATYLPFYSKKTSVLSSPGQDFVKQARGRFDIRLLSPGESTTV